MAGLAGCGGDGDGENTPTETTEPMDTTESPETTDPPETTETPETTAPPETTEPPETDTPNTSFGDDPEQLLEIEGGYLQTGETQTVSGELTNPYLFTIESVEVTAVAARKPTGFSRGRKRVRFI